jgi:uncharacterized membrane protein
MKSKCLSSIMLLPLLAAGGCAGPIGPGLGLGPGLDQLVFFGILIGIGAIAWPRVRNWTSNHSNLLPYSLNQSESRATAIAAERYAKGEITRDEYLKLLDDLRRQTT